MSRRVLVHAPARLHMGLIDLRGDLGRRFGGIGAALEEPRLVLEAEEAPALSAQGEGAERVLAYARRYLEHHGLALGATLRVRQAIPPHSGLGSGTQLALATARALASLCGRDEGAAALSEATGRGRRSAVGTWTFQEGGFVLDGGRRDGDSGPAPLLLRLPMPEAWRCLVLLPDVPSGLSGEQEEEAFRLLPQPTPEVVGRIARLILVSLLPSLVEADLESFGAALSEVQREVGDTFRPAQGERFAHGPIRKLVSGLLEAGAAGAGQSSWGPAVFGVFPDEGSCRSAAEALAPRLGSGGRYFVSAFRNRGADCAPAP